ncbi:hypothetical protein LOZ53_001891 [Ophidiomyces ophidiicola]|nr:hypothetical protein LOZ55_004343 [Ophidiomyces ophidiicola]KAI1985216.1 hypothetical protein LOZ51_006458 [Ophidiomyces ophidiicola]KAI1990631.1 hypothetical protein LOZ54_002434 [Ophidiomyces ophidiicola]KAI1994164.1 hypothetical protein LOZ53_001891 [Ophidiomyces ophidiicola]
MAWVTKSGRFLKFLWKAGTTGVPGIAEAVTHDMVERAVERITPRFPEFKNAKIVQIRSRPHETRKADGKLDPLHVNVHIMSEDDRLICSAHFYPIPLGGRQVWFSKPIYNDGDEPKNHWVKCVEPKKDNDKKKD